MSLKMAVIALAVATAGTVFGVPAWSQTVSRTATNPEIKLAAEFNALAGSQRNADSLIKGLRDGKNILLITSLSNPNPTAPSVTFTPVTGKLGYGDINIALSLAKADLAKQGITNPTPAQLAAALNGGTITTANGAVTMAGVLAQRQSGLGWGQIANAMGVKLGAVVSASKTDKASKKDVSALKAEIASGSGSKGKSEQTHTGTSGNKGGNSGGGGSNSSSSGGGGGGKGK